MLKVKTGNIFTNIFRHVENNAGLGYFYKFLKQTLLLYRQKNF